MKRTLLVSGFGIAALLGGSLVLVFRLTGRPSPADSATAPAVAIAQSQEAGPVAPPTAPLPRTAPRGGGMSRVWWKPPVDDPSATPMAGRVIQKSVHKALLASPVQSRLGRCVHRDDGFGGSGAPGRIPRGKPALLMLEIEGLGGEVRIVEAKVHAWGEASAEAVSCAQNVLRGQVIRTSAAERGRRMRMSFPLNPRSGALAAR